MGSSCDITHIADECGTTISAAGQAYYEIGEEYHIEWLRKKALEIEPDDRWAEEARDGLIDQLYSCQAGLTAHILQTMKSEIKAKKIGPNTKISIVKAWQNKVGHLAKQFEPVYEDLKQVGDVDIPMLIIAEQRLRNLYGG